MFASAGKGKKTAKNLNTLNDGLHTAANHAGQAVREMIHSAGNEVTHAGDRIRTEIRINPLRSGAIALGIGVVLGMLLRR